MSNRRSYILQAFMENPWAILPAKLVVLEGVFTRYVAGEDLSSEEVGTTIHGAARPQQRQVGAVAVLPLFGTIFPRANLMTTHSGATSAETFGKQFDALVKDPEISAIVLDVNSPGGQVNGIEELSRKIYEARGTKPIVAVANHMMASAAYWIGTAADEVVVSPSGMVGSVGVFAAHTDHSEALAQDGMKVTLISAGKYKTEANPYEALSEEAHANIQESVSETYDTFIEALARNRGAKPALVRAGFGEGRTVSAKRAVELGMADRVATLEETINSLFSVAATQTLEANTPQESNTNIACAADVEKNAQVERLRQRISDIRSQYHESEISV